MTLSLLVQILMFMDARTRQFIVTRVSRHWKEATKKPALWTMLEVRVGESCDVPSLTSTLAYAFANGLKHLTIHDPHDRSELFTHCNMPFLETVTITCARLLRLEQQNQRNDDIRTFLNRCPNLKTFVFTPQCGTRSLRNVRDPRVMFSDNTCLMSCPKCQKNADVFKCLSCQVPILPKWNNAQSACDHWTNQRWTMISSDFCCWCSGTVCDACRQNTNSLKPCSNPDGCRHNAEICGRCKSQRANDSDHAMCSSCAGQCWPCRPFFCRHCSILEDRRKEANEEANRCFSESNWSKVN
jgi:hypothetical protein